MAHFKIIVYQSDPPKEKYWTSPDLGGGVRRLEAKLALHSGGTWLVRLGSRRQRRVETGSTDSVKIVVRFV